jgi:hypothetical protein
MNPKYLDPEIWSLRMAVSCFQSWNELPNNNNKSINQMSKKKSNTMELEKEIIKLDRESYNRLKDMFQSTDKENHTVAFSILKNLEVKPNLPYMLLLYKLFKDTTGDAWKEIVPGMEKEVTKMGKGKLDNTTYNNLWRIIEGSYPKEELNEIVNEFADVLKGHVDAWGFHFLKYCDWKITVR